MTQQADDVTAVLSDIEIRVIAVQAAVKIVAAEAGGRGSTGNNWAMRAREIARYIKTGA